MEQENRKEIMNHLARVFLVLFPLFLSLILSLVEKRGLFSVFPILSNDEVSYWREMYSFDRCGFDFGKNGWLGYEPASIGSFGCHGLLQVAAWGWYTLLFEWTHHSIAIANFIMLEAAFLLFAVLVRPDSRQCLIIILFSLCFRPLSIYLNTSLMEIPCFAAIILYFALFVWYCRKPDSRLRLFFCLIVGLYCSVLRICYIVILFPAIMVSNDYRIDLKLVLKMLLYVAVFFVLYLIYNRTTAEYPQWFLTELKQESGLLDRVFSIALYFKTGLIRYFTQIWERIVWFYSGYASLDGIRYLLTVSFPELFFPIRILNLFLLIFLLVPDFKEKNFVFDKEKLSLFVMLLTFNFGIIALYDVSGWVDTRVISSLLYGIFLWIIVRYSGRISKGVFVILGVILLACSLFMIRITPIKDNGTYIMKDYGETFDVLAQYEGKRSIAVDLELIDGKDAFNFVNSVPANFGFLIYTDEKQLNEFRPEFIYSLSELKLNGYRIISDDNGFIYMRK